MNDPFELDGNGGGATAPRRAARAETVEQLNPFLFGAGEGPSGEVRDTLSFGRVQVDLKRGNPLVTAGGEVLTLAERLRNKPDEFASMSDIRTAAQRGLQFYRNQIGRSLVEDEPERDGELILAALIDDIALNGPWPGKADWRQHPLAPLSRQGQQVFDIMEEALADPPARYAVLELVYVALALGFEGPFRTDARGPLLLIQYRERLLTTMRDHGRLQQRTSVSLGSQTGAHKALAFINPFTMVLAGILFIAASLALAVWIFGDAGPPIVAEDDGGDPSVLRAPDLQPQPDRVPGKVRALLQGDIATRMVSFSDSGTSMVVGVSGDMIFQSGTAAPDQANGGLVRRIGAAVGAARGPVYLIAQREPANPDLAAQRLAALGRQLDPWARERGQRLMSIITEPAEASPATPDGTIRIVLGKGVRPSSLDDDAYLLPRWY
ncbi:MAG: type IVB secretion system protein IcmH/DotU [Sphingomonadales bacterium]